jgi:hypothetical protein
MSQLEVSITHGATMNDTVETGEIVLSNTPPSEFERFENLAAKLLKVPKSELDEERKRES